MILTCPGPIRGRHNPDPWVSVQRSVSQSLVYAIICRKCLLSHSSSVSLSSLFSVCAFCICKQTTSERGGRNQQNGLRCRVWAWLVFCHCTKHTPPGHDLIPVYFLDPFLTAPEPASRSPPLFHSFTLWPIERLTNPTTSSLACELGPEPLQSNCLIGLYNKQSKRTQTILWELHIEYTNSIYIHIHTQIYTMHYPYCRNLLSKCILSDSLKDSNNFAETLWIQLKKVLFIY